MLSLGDMAALIAAEEKRLGVNSQEFMEHHNEIMILIEQAQKTLASAGNTSKSK